MFGAVIISGRTWLLPVAVFLAVSLGLVAWSYWRDSAHGAVRVVCALLKLLGLLTLGAVLLEPLWSGERARPGANLFVVMADNSEGMRIKDRGAAQSRGEVMRGLLTGETASWPAKLEDNFQVRRYLFDSRLQSTRDFSGLDFDGRATSLASALRNIADRYQGQPLSGVLLLTDGNATDLTDGHLDTTGLPPVFPVVMGTDETIKDISLQRVTVSQTAFEDAPVSIQADAAQGGYSGRDIVAQLFDASGKKVEEQTLRAGNEGEVLPFRFEAKPDKPGVSFYRLRVSARDELGQFDNPETSTEATLANNSRVVPVNRGRGPYRILYVAGQPKWEFKFMNRALSEDDQIELSSLIRVAKREPKFDFRGRSGESSNPLFRGFDNQAKDEVPQYDQPVLERQLPPEADTNELIDGFPKTAEELFKYNAVVVDDLEAEFFTQDQMQLIKRFVAERGGGFMMMGGTDSFHEGDYDRTPISDLLPVYIDHVPNGPPLTNEQFALSKEGWVQPWARLRPTEADERQRLDEMPRFTMTGVNRVRELKPGASLIATVHDETDGDHPALVVQRFGNGRVAALLVSSIWSWGFHDPESHKDMDKAWRQLYRWLVADVPTRVDFHVSEKPGDPNEAVLLQVRVKDKLFQPMDNAGVVFSVQSVTNSTAGNTLLASTNVVRLTADPSSSEPGLYEATYIPRETGGYLAAAVATDSEGAEVGRAEAGWTADPAAEEFKSLKPNRVLMEQLAQQTGGQIISANGLDAFVSGLPNRKAPVMDPWTVPLWHRPAVFLFALGCFVAEWGLRRSRGMA